ncbi:MAG: hypothetical protein ACXU8S_16410 [Phenylobacterium sp.]
MLRLLIPAAAVLALSAAPALAQSSPTPGEQNSMHTGTTAANGSSTIVTDRNGTHPDGYPGYAVVNHASGSSAAMMRHRRHHRRPVATSEPSGR